MLLFKCLFNLILRRLVCIPDVRWTVWILVPLRTDCFWYRRDPLWTARSVVMHSAKCFLFIFLWYVYILLFFTQVNITCMTCRFNHPLIWKWYPPLWQEGRTHLQPWPLPSTVADRRSTSPLSPSQGVSFSSSFLERRHTHCDRFLHCTHHRARFSCPGKGPFLPESLFRRRVFFGGEYLQFTHC